MLRLTGLVKGIKTEQKTDNNGQPYTVNHVGIEVEKTGGYAGETLIYDIRPSRQQQEAGILKVYSDNVGKIVHVPVWVNAWVSKNGNTGINYHLSGDGRPQAVASK